MEPKESLDALCMAGKQIAQNPGVQNAVNNLGKSVVQGATGVVVTAGSTLLGSGSAASVTAAATAAGHSIASAAAGLGSAVVTVVTASPILTVLVGAGLCGLAAYGVKKLFSD